MRVFIDDVRDPNFVGWDISECKILRTSDEAIAFLLPILQDPTQDLEISFDHDLGIDDDSIIIGLRLEEEAYYGRIKCRISWKIHSMNPVGSRNLRFALEAMDSYIPFRGIKNSVRK